MADTRTIAETVAALAGEAADRFPDHIAARYKSDEDWREMSYADAGKAINELALGLVDLGIEPGDRVCLLANTRLEWVLAMYAISAAGAVVVPVYPTNSPNECKWVAGNSGARALICEDAGQRKKIDQVRDELRELEHVIGITSEGGELSFEELRERGAKREESE